MAELFGTAAGVLQVAEAGFNLATTLYKYASTVKGAEKDIKRIARDVRLTSKVLERTHEQLKADQQAQLCTDDALIDLEDVLDGCREAFQEVDDALNKSMKPSSGRPMVSLTEKLKWPLKQDKLEVLRANLEKLKTTLLLMLSVLAYGSKMQQSQASKTDITVQLSLEKLQIQNLIQARDEATSRYEELTAAFSKLEARISDNTKSVQQPIHANATISMMALPGPSLPEHQPRAEQKQPSANRQPHAVSTQLVLCASAVSRLTTTIDSATRRWDSDRVLEHDGISRCLQETTEAVESLRRHFDDTDLSTLFTTQSDGKTKGKGPRLSLQMPLKSSTGKIGSAYSHCNSSEMTSGPTASSYSALNLAELASFACGRLWSTSTPAQRENTIIPAPEGDLAPTSWRRHSRKRTKTGCVTCRKRRIRCGEERPECQNCIKTQGDCEGYNQRVILRPPIPDRQQPPPGIPFTTPTIQPYAESGTAESGQDDDDSDDGLFAIPLGNPKQRHDPLRHEFELRSYDDDQILEDQRSNSSNICDAPDEWREKRVHTQPAQVEDCDSDEGFIAPEAIVHAGGPMNAMKRSPQRRDPGTLSFTLRNGPVPSDSGAKSSGASTPNYAASYNDDVASSGALEWSTAFVPVRQVSQDLGDDEDEDDEEMAKEEGLQEEGDEESDAVDNLLRRWTKMPSAPS